MKSIIIISIAVFVMAAGVFGFTSNVSADYNTPGTPTNSELFDQGDPLGRGPRGGRNGVDAPGDGLLHDELISAFSEAVGVPVAEIETRIEAGETLADIAVSKGFTITEFRAIMDSIHNAAIDQAVLNGDLTQEQADFMKNRGNRMNGENGNRQNGDSANTGRGMMGQGRFSNPDCPLTTPTAP